MKNQISKYLLITLIIIFSILLATLIYIKFFGTNKKNEYEILSEKVEGEVKYLDNTIIELMNKLNNISYTRYQVTIKEVNESEQLNNSSSNSQSAGNGMQTTEQGNSNNSGDNSSGNNESESINQSEARTSRLEQTDSLLDSNYNDIPWDEISYGVETIYTAWPSINLDMKALNINENDISNFSTTLDGIAQAVKAQDKNIALINLYNLYTLLTKYLSSITSNEYVLNVYNTKAYVLNAYVSVDNENWEEINNSINNAIDTLSKNLNINTSDLNDTEKSTIEKSYVLLEELKRGVGLEDKEIFYLKYKLAMEQLEIL